MNKFKELIRQKFHLESLTKPNLPIKVFTHSLNWVPFRVNHLCLKLDNSEDLELRGLPESIKELVQKLVDWSKTHNLPISDRYLFLTVDTIPFEAGTAQRTPGWHIDGLQGEEVPIKQDADYQFILCNKIPTLFTTQAFNMDGVDLAHHNLFEVLARQINPQEVFPIDCQTVYLMNPYMAHTAGISETGCTDRIFFRLSFSKVPVTSAKMTINPYLKYNYKIHQTSGEIPNYLQLPPK